MKNLLFDPGCWQALRQACEAGYPKEVCGLLLGRPGANGDRRVERIEVLSNILDGRHGERLNRLLEAGAVSISKERALQGGNYEFLIDPQEHYDKVARAASEGLDQIGLFHSHPDHPPAPSATDASQPFLVGWSNIIVAVRGGKFSEAKSWSREREDVPFQEEIILVQ